VSTHTRASTPPTPPPPLATSDVATIDVAQRAWKPQLKFTQDRAAFIGGAEEQGLTDELANLPTQSVALVWYDTAFAVAQSVENLLES
jgi:hypothetical protein